MIETGYFGNIKNYPETDTLICVSYKWPWFIKMEKMMNAYQLAPPRQVLYDYKDGLITWEEYEEKYREHAKQDWFVSMVSLLREQHENGEVIRLMCWEKEPPCHRFILKDIILCGEE